MLALVFLLAGCAAPALPLACAAGAPALSATLFFGRALHGGGAVTDGDWRDFLAATVTPRFPDGLTTLDGQGQWRPREGAPVTREASSVVVIIAAPGEATQRKLQEIRDAYRARFAQDSVGLVTAPVCASF
jgi:hypothetical protein